MATHPIAEESGEGARRRFAFLASASATLSASLDYTTTLASVARLCVPELADWCVVDLVSRHGAIRRVAVVCADPEKEELAIQLQERYPARLDRPEGTPKVLRTGRGELIPEVSDEWLSAIAPDAEQLAILRGLGLVSNLLVPLRARGRTLGVLALATAESGRRYGEIDLALAEELGQHAALAVDNARLYRESEEAAHRKEAQYEATRILAEAESLAQAAPQLLQALSESLDWQTGALWTVDETAGVIRCVEFWSRAGPSIQPFEEQTRSLALARGNGVPGRVWAEPEPVWVADVLQDPNFPRAATALQGGLRAAFAFPILLRGKFLGVIEFFSPSVREPDEDLLRMVTAVGTQMGQFLERREIEAERARLLAAERDARAEAEAARRRFEFLAEASKLLGLSLAYERTLESIAALAVPRLADWCAIDMVDEGGVRRLALAHVDPKKTKWANELQARYPPDLDARTGVAKVLRTGRAELVPEISDELLVAAARDEDHLALLRELGLASYMCVPFVAHDRVLGAVTLVAAESGRRYGSDDLALAEELARRAAVAIENAQLYRAAEERAEATRVLAHVADGVFLLDGDGAVRLWNQAAEAITGLAAPETIGRAAAEAIPGWAEVAAIVPLGSAEASARRSETVPLQIGERELWLSISGVSFDEGTVYAFRDVTEERAVEQLKSDFLSTVSHELRTPLATIYGAALTLRRTDVTLDDAQSDRLLALIAEESDRLAHRVTAILSAGSLEAGALRFDIQRFDAAELVREVAATTKRQLPDRHELVVSVAPDLPPGMADRDKVMQVLVNMLDNAVKYSPQGGAIRLAVERRELWLRFSVSDEGFSIPESELERVFEKFYRLDPQMTRGVSGTGLGLYISRELVRRMGGRIWATSGEREGSTFYVELPAAASQAGSENVNRAPVGSASL